MNNKSLHRRLSTLPAVILLIGLFVTACQSAPQRRHDYTIVPVREAAANLSADQKMLVSSKGVPDFVWQKPFDTFLWVYCIQDSPAGLFEFDAQGMLIGQSSANGNDLCGKQH